MPDFSCSHRYEGGTAVVTVVGDVDLAAVDGLWKELSSQLDRSNTVVMDCGGITFMDSSGLQVLLRAYYRSATKNARFRLIKPSKAVRRVLKLSGLSHVLPVFDETGVPSQRER